MTENKRYEFDAMNGGGYVVGYSERMSDDISLFFTRLCEVPTKTQAEKVCNELKGLQKENEELKSELRKIYDVATINKAIEIVDNIYEELVYKTSEESKYKRDIILKCLEKLDNFKDDIE